MLVITLGLTFTTTVSFLTGALFIRSVFSADKKLELGFLLGFAITNGFTFAMVLNLLGK